MEEDDDIMLSKPALADLLPFECRLTPEEPDAKAERLPKVFLGSGRNMFDKFVV